MVILEIHTHSDTTKDQQKYQSLFLFFSYKRPQSNYTNSDKNYSLHTVHCFILLTVSSLNFCISVSNVKLCLHKNGFLLLWKQLSLTYIKANNTPLGEGETASTSSGFSYAFSRVTWKQYQVIHSVFSNKIPIPQQRHAFMHIFFESHSSHLLQGEWVTLINYSYKTMKCTPRINTVIHRTLQWNIAYTIFYNILMSNTR